MSQHEIDPDTLRQIRLYPPENAAPKDAKANSTDEQPEDNRPKHTSHHHHRIHPHRFIPRDEWAIIAHGIGAIRDVEQTSAVHPKH